jgi:hypothetical protein
MMEKQKTKSNQVMKASESLLAQGQIPVVSYIAVKMICFKRQRVSGVGEGLMEAKALPLPTSVLGRAFNLTKEYLTH